MTPIDKNIPISERNWSSGRKPKYPFRDMEVGDSFLVTEVTNATRGLAGVLNYRFETKHFVSRTVEGGIRVWRDK